MRIQNIISKLKSLFSVYFFNPQTTPPEIIYIEVTGFCNFKCPNCPRTFSENKRGHMADEVFYKTVQKISDDYPTLKNIGFHFFGEILLRPNFHVLIRHARELLPCTSFAVSTNLAVKKKDLMNKLLDSGFNSIGIWPDGFSNESYNKIRTGGEFKDIVKNIRYLLKERDLRKFNNSVSVHVGMVRNKVNFKNIAVFYNIFKFVKNHKNTFLVIDDSHDWAGQIPSENVIDSAQHMFFKIPIPCRMPYNTLIVAADGNVSLCCFDMDLQLNVGNIMISGIKELWASEKTAEIRNAIKRFKPPKLCKNCVNSYIYGRKILNKIVSKKEKLSVFDVDKHLSKIGKQ